MKIGIDLRCLNYPKYTGVNSYCLHILDCIWNIKKKSITEIQIVGIGLTENRLFELKNEFVLFNNLFDSFRTLSEYYNNNFDNNKLLEIFSITQIYLQNSLNSDNIEEFSYIIQPQPRLIKLNPKTKLVSFYHDFFDLLENKFNVNKIINNKKSFKIISDRCYRIVTNSRSTSQDFNKLSSIKDEKICLVYPGKPDLDSLRKNKLDQDTRTLSIVSGKYLLAISGIEPRKNWHNLILAFKKLQINYNYNKKLVLSGTVVDRNYNHFLLKLISSHNIKNIEWVIGPDEETKKNLICNCDLLVYPSFYEGFGFPLLEAQDYNKPIITSKNSSLVEISPACSFVNPNNYLSIASGILISEKTESVSPEVEFDWFELELFFTSLLK